MKKVDLHMHSKCSDGKYSGYELIDFAVKNNTSAISITDHDTISVYTDDLFEYAKDKGVELISGIEFSTRTKDKKKYHIVGLCIDYKNQEMLKVLEKLKQERFDYLEKAVNLFKELGFDFDRSYVSFEDGVPTKAHIARGIINCENNLEKLKSIFGKMPTEGQLIETYMLRGQKACVDQDSSITPKDAIDLIHKSGGVAILAHPASYVIAGDVAEDFIKNLIDLGIDGLENINIQFNRSKNDEEVDMVDFFTKLAKENNLLQSGGSDFHSHGHAGLGNVIELGMINSKYSVPYECLEKIKETAIFKYQK